MNLDTATVIGLSRQPLDEETQALAAQLMTQAGKPAEEALALLAAKSIARRANLSKSSVQGVEVPESIPDHPSYLLLENHIFNYLEASLAFRGKADVRPIFERGLVVPASKIPWYLEAVIRKATVEPEAYALLGRHGLWLSLKHPTFKRKVAFLNAETFPKSAKQREAYLQFWWSELRRSERAKAPDFELVNRFRKLFTSTNLKPQPFGLLQKVLDRGVLAKAVDSSVLLDLFSRKRELTDLEILRLECFLDEGRLHKMMSRASEVLATLPTGSDRRDAFEVVLRGEAGNPAFLAWAKAAISSQHSGAAATLLQHAATSEDRLIKGQNILPQLASVLDATSYADLMDYAHDCYPKGWRDPMVVAFVGANPHPFSTKLSEEFASEAVLGYAPPAETVLGRYPHKLSSSVLGHLLALKHDHNSEILNALLAMTLAKQRIESAFPVF